MKDEVIFSFGFSWFQYHFPSLLVAHRRKAEKIASDDRFWKIVRVAVFFLFQSLMITMSLYFSEFKSLLLLKSKKVQGN